MTKTNDQLLAEATAMIQQQALTIKQYENAESKNGIEYRRFKQDCRKRALDLAHSQVHTPVFQKYIEDNRFVDIGENTVSDKSPIIADDILIALADKYYQWLITIPTE